jgi:TPR repeat protein
MKPHVATRRLIAAACLLVAVGTARAESTDDYTLALYAYDACRWQEAMALLERGADAGDARAQEMLGMMHLAGPALYGADVPQDADAGVRWLERAAAQGSEAARVVVRARMRIAQSAIDP